MITPRLNPWATYPPTDILVATPPMLINPQGQVVTAFQKKPTLERVE